jgi:outer membrane protein assembly factor BamB
MLAVLLFLRKTTWLALSWAGLITQFSLQAQADWPQFRGESSQGIAQSRLPTQWSNSNNIRWRQEIPGQGWSSPIVVGQRIFLTAAIPINQDKLALSLLILDAESGQLVASVTLFEQAADASPIHSKNSHASPTPVFDGKNLYLHFGHQGTACCSLDGRVIWANAELSYAPVHGNGGSPVIVGDSLIFSRDGATVSQLLALDSGTGEVAWELERNAQASRKFSFCTPLLIVVNGQQQLIAPGSDVVQSVDPQTGRELWRVRYSGYSVVPRPVYDSGLVFISTGFDQASLLAIDPSGEGDVTESHIKWSEKSGVPKTSSFIATKGQVMMVSDNGVLACFESVTGKQQWKKRIGGGFSSSLLLAGPMLYALDESGKCTVVDVSGSEPQVVATNALEERTLSSPAVIESDLLIRSDKALYRISQNSPAAK